MNFSHYYPDLLAFTERLLNSHDPMKEDPESLHTVADLQVLVGDAPLARLSFDESDVAEIRLIRQQLRSFFQETSTDALEEALNQALQSVKVGIRVDASTGQGLLALPAESRPSRQLYAGALISLAWAFNEYGGERFRACQAAPCKDVFIDTSKNGQRRFCGPRCANRAHSRAYREREGNA